MEILHLFLFLLNFILRNEGVVFLECQNWRWIHVQIWVFFHLVCLSSGYSRTDARSWIYSHSQTRYQCCMQHCLKLMRLYAGQVSHSTDLRCFLAQTRSVDRTIGHYNLSWAQQCFFQQNWLSWCWWSYWIEDQANATESIRCASRASEELKMQWWNFSGYVAVRPSWMEGEDAIFFFFFFSPFHLIIKLR